MNPIRFTLYAAAAISIGFALPVSPAFAADSAPSAMSGAELASRLNAGGQAGTSLVRLRLEVKEASGAASTVLQLQVKERRSGEQTEAVYQVLWPKERKGEAILLRRAGRSISGTHFVPPDTMRPVGAAQLSEPFFGSDLSYQDVIENFFDWDNQAIVGTEEVDKATCYILESKPGKSDRSPYSMVRSWVDTRRFVPLRIEKYSGGKVVRRIDTTQVIFEARTRHIPAKLTIRGPRGGAVTELDGSRIRHGMKFEDREFTPEGLKEIKAPRGGEE